MILHLLSEKIATEVTSQQSHIRFEDSSVAGSRIIAGGYIDKYLMREVEDIVSEVCVKT